MGDFASLDLDQLATVSGGVNWRKVHDDGASGAARGAMRGAVMGSIAGPPGAVVGAARGGVTGYLWGAGRSLVRETTGY